MWLQNRREATVERTRTTSSVRRDDPGEFRVGRLKHERVKVPRGESLMEWAENVMQIHADRKSVLEVPLYKFRFAQSCPTLTDPMDCSLPGSSVHGILHTLLCIK